MLDRAAAGAISHSRVEDRFNHMHRITDPALLYFGTPVVLISTLNCDATPNLAPMSSAWWLGHNAMLGLAGTSMTTQNLLRERECVLNLPDVTMVEHVDRIAKTTGSSPLPEGKLGRGYRHVADKFGLAELSAIPSDLVKAPRVMQCPIQLEATLVDAHSFGGFAQALEVRIESVHAKEDVLATERPQDDRGDAVTLEHRVGAASSGETTTGG